AAGKGFAEFSKTRHVSSLTYLTLSWVGFCLLFFSFSKSKLPGYVLPAVPPIAFLLSRILAAGTPLKPRTAVITLTISRLIFLCAVIYLYFQLQDYSRFVPLHSHRLSFGETI